MSSTESTTRASNAPWHWDFEMQGLPMKSHKKPSTGRFCDGGVCRSLNDQTPGPWWSLSTSDVTTLDETDGINPKPRSWSDRNRRTLANRTVEDRMLVIELLDSLTHRQREVLVLRYVGQLSVPEIARSLNCAEGTIKSTLHMATRESISACERSGTCR